MQWNDNAQKACAVQKPSGQVPGDSLPDTIVKKNTERRKVLTNLRKPQKRLYPL